MARVFHVLAGAVVVAALFTLASCGGSDEIVRFDSRPHASIAKSTLNHWMQAIAGGEIRRNLGAEGPPGLASEPPDYPHCFAAAKLVGPRSFFNQLRYDKAQVTEKCHQLHRVIKAQALSFLISAHWTLVESAARKIAASRAEIREAVEELTRQRHPSRAFLQHYLAERHWSLSDLLYQAKLDALVRKLRPQRAQALAQDLGGFASFVRAPQQYLIATTICRAGYVVPGCRGYSGSWNVSSATAALLDQLTGSSPSSE